MNISNVSIPKRGLLFAIGDTAPLESALLRPLRAAERVDGPELSLYNDRNEAFSGTSFLTPETADFFAEKILHEMHSRLVVMSAASSGNFPARFRDFLFTSADQLVVMKSGDDYLRGIISRQRVKKLGFLPLRPPASNTLKPDEAIVLTRLRLNGRKTHGPENWDRCQVVRLRMTETPSMDQALRR